MPSACYAAAQVPFAALLLRPPLSFALYGSLSMSPRKIIIIIMPVLIVVGALFYRQYGYTSISFQGLVPNEVVVIDSGEIVVKKLGSEISKSNGSFGFKSDYAHYNITLAYQENIQVSLTLCNQNHWYKNKLVIKENIKESNSLSVTLNNEEDSQEIAIPLNGSSEEVSIGICG